MSWSCTADNKTLINGCKAFESAGLSPADSDSAQNDSISGCRSGSRNETAAMRNFGSPYGRYWMVRPSSSLAASEAGQGAAKSRSKPCHTHSTAQSPRSASKSARTRSTWQGRTSVMRCTAKQAQARNQVSLHAIRAGEGGREFRQSPPFERFAAYRRATTSRELCSARFLLSRCPLWVRSGGDDRDRPASDVRFAPKADIIAGLSESALCANNRHRGKVLPTRQL